MTTAPGLVAAFGAGLISFVSPCVLPLVPGYLSLISGLGSSEVQSQSVSARKRLAGQSLLFVLGFSVVFILYGAVASGLGSLVLQHKAFLGQLSGVLIIAMGLVVAGVFRSSLLMRERRFHLSPQRLGPYASPVMGMAFAFGWTPCIGPVLAAVLTLAAGRDTLGQGVSLLGAYSLGLGVPFVATAVGFASLRAGWKWFGRHGAAINRVSGGILVIFGTLLLTGQLGRVSSVIVTLWAKLGLYDLTVG